MPKEKKPKKEKPPKEKKPKKEKPPKEKKPKKEKPGKEKPEKAGEGGETPEEEEEKKGSPLKLILIILPVLLIAAGAAFFFLRIRPMMQAKNQAETEEASGAASDGAAEDEAEAAAEDGSEEEGAEEEAPDGGDEESGSDGAAASDGAAPSGGGGGIRVEQAVTTGEAVSYFRSLSPSSLGLEGDNMDSYEILPSEGMIMVDGLMCTEITVYNNTGRAGTNDILGKYLMTRSGVRRVFKLNEWEKTVEEISIAMAPPEVQAAAAEADAAEAEGAEAPDSNDAPEKP